MSPLLCPQGYLEKSKFLEKNSGISCNFSKKCKNPVLTFMLIQFFFLNV